MSYSDTPFRLTLEMDSGSTKRWSQDFYRKFYDKGEIIDWQRQYRDVVVFGTSTTYVDNDAGRIIFRDGSAITVSSGGSGAISSTTPQVPDAFPLPPGGPGRRHEAWQERGITNGSEIRARNLETIRQRLTPGEYNG